MNGPDDRPEITSQLSDRIIPLDTSDPTADLGDLDSLRTVFGDKTIVGMGESTHGTREFFRIKHRLFRFLVEELDFRLFGLEADFTQTLAINEYVFHGRGDPVKALFAEEIPWPWRSESVLDLIKWIRVFNDGRDPADRVKFYGFDMQFPRGPATAIEAFLRDIDPDTLDTVHDDLMRLTEKWVFLQSSGTEREANIAAAERVVTTLTETFAEGEETYIEATSPKEFEVIRRQLRTIEQATEQTKAIHYDVGDGENIRTRDEAMAENVSWILSHEPADRIALWGHNAHLLRGPVADGFFGVNVDSMGEHLAAEYGEQYYALGFDFGYGSFRTVSMVNEEFVDYTVEEIPEESLPGILATVDQPIFVLNFIETSNDSEVPNLLTDERQRYMISGRYEKDEDIPVNYVESTITDVFDGLVFVKETTPSVNFEPPKYLESSEDE